jgi:hypothetical protein
MRDEWRDGMVTVVRPLLSCDRREEDGDGPAVEDPPPPPSSDDDVKDSMDRCEAETTADDSLSDSKTTSSFSPWKDTCLLLPRTSDDVP